MNIIVDNKKILKPLCFENKKGKVIIVLYKKRLKLVLKLALEKNADFFKEIMNCKYRICSSCGYGYMTYYPYTYRDNCGCIGISYECEICKRYSDKSIYKIAEHARRHGTKKPIKTF